MAPKAATVGEDLCMGEQSLDAGPQLDTAAWLEDPATTRFSYPIYNPACGYIEGFMTVRKERRARGGAYWTAYWRVGGCLRKTYLGRSPAVTSTRLRIVGAAWLAQLPAAGPW